jgi:hypothetical protein
MCIGFTYHPSIKLYKIVKTGKKQVTWEMEAGQVGVWGEPELHGMNLSQKEKECK